MFMRVNARVVGALLNRMPTRGAGYRYHYYYYNHYNYNSESRESRAANVGSRRRAPGRSASCAAETSIAGINPPDRRQASRRP